MFVLGIGNDVDPSELNQIASGPRNVFTVDSFGDLSNRANSIKRGICKLGNFGNYSFMCGTDKFFFACENSFINKGCCFFGWNLPSNQMERQILEYNFRSLCSSTLIFCLIYCIVFFSSSSSRCY